MKKTERIEDLSFDSVVIDDTRISDIDKQKPKIVLEKKIKEAEIFRVYSLITKSKQESCYYRYFCCNGYFDNNTGCDNNNDCLEYFWYWYWYCFYINHTNFPKSNSSNKEHDVKCCDCNECECKVDDDDQKYI